MSSNHSREEENLVVDSLSMSALAEISRFVFVLSLERDALEWTACCCCWRDIWLESYVRNLVSPRRAPCESVKCYDFFFFGISPICIQADKAERCDLFSKFAFVKENDDFFFSFSTSNRDDVASSREHCLSHVRLLLAILALKLCHRFKASDSVSGSGFARLFSFSEPLVMTTTM